MTATTTTARRAPGTRLLALHNAINNVLLRAWCAAPSGWGRGTIHVKAKAPVLQNTFGQAVATPTESGVLSRPDFWVRLQRRAPVVSDVVGVIRKDARTACPVF